MKKLIILLCFVYALIFLNKTFAWDTTAAKFYPLSVGNYYVFEDKHLIMSCIYNDYTNYYAVEIVSDTVFPNGKKYYKFDSNWWLFSGLKYQRVDSNSMNVYAYNTYTSEEQLLDSLFANEGDTYLGKRNPFGVGPCIVDTITFQYLLNATRHTKEIISGGSISFYYSLVEGLGFYSHFDCELGTGSSITLKGCIINGILYGDTTMSGIQQISTEVPEIYELHQNYPNPFNPITKIKFDITNSSFVKMVVYNSLGQEVETLVNEKLGVGSYEVEWSGENYPSGVYFYKLVAEKYVEVKKMALVK